MKVILLYISLACCIPSLCQEYNYIHYDTKDGLPSSTVYWMCEDKKGYIWFATNNGVSRFDGKKFTNFTTEDGLTDNEILDVSVDSKGRVWMSPFDKTICYYYEGKIYSAKNDSTLKNFSFQSYGSMATEDKEGNIYFIVMRDGIFLYKKTGQIKRVADFKQLALQYGLELEQFLPMTLPHLYPNDVVVFNGPLVFITRGDTLIHFKTVPTNVPGKNNIYKIDNDLKFYYTKEMFRRSFKVISRINGYAFFNSTKGSWRMDSLGNRDTITFLPGKNVSWAIADREGNTWFATLGEGVYRLTSSTMKTFSKEQEVFCIEKINGSILAGTANGSMLKINNRLAETIAPDPGDQITKLHTIKVYKETIYQVFDLRITKLQPNRKTIAYKIYPIKSLAIAGEEHIAICTNAATLRLKSSNMEIADTLWRERGTKVIYDKGSFYIGTLSGLVIFHPDKTVTKTIGHIPLLRRRIVDMCKNPGNGIWIATNDIGVLFYQNGQADTVFTVHKGLSSNTCNTLFLKDRYLWIGTMKGINKIDLTTKKVVASYGTADGLPSDIINAIYVDDSLVWVGTSDGLTYFREKDATPTSICNLDLHSAYVSGKKVNLQYSLYLSWKNNNISFDFAAISFKSAGDITYYYKLNGLDNDWKQTRVTTLSYPSLPPGDYTFQLYAINKFGKKSDTATVLFHIAAPFWRTVWFWLASLALAAGLIWFLLNRRYKRLQNKEKEKTELQRQMKELEHAALRAQMNPHFIFNCLNSIQAFVIKNDIEQTNKYITRFGHLIRQTLDNSGKENLSLADELAYMTNYIELEQMRASFLFGFKITIDPELDTDQVFIPSMLLQPFIENAIRHGIRNKKNDGLIKLDIQATADEVIFHIEDNGIGREAAGKYKALQRIEYQSKGMALTQNRIEVLNSVNTEKITTAVTDIMDQDGHIAGTKVTISFPRSVMEKQA